MLYWMLCFRMHVVKRESRKKNMFRSTHFHHDSEVHGLIPHSKLYHPRDLIVNMRPKRSKKLEDPTWRIQEPQTTDRSLEFSSNNWSRLWKYSSLVGNFNPKKNTWVQFVAMYVRLPEESNVYIYIYIILLYVLASICSNLGSESRNTKHHGASSNRNHPAMAKLRYPCKFKKNMGFSCLRWISPDLPK